MIEDINIKKKLVNNWFVFLQSEICKQFQKLEKSKVKINAKKFKKRIWNKDKMIGGGGTSFFLKNGAIFDQVGVNQSTVHGKFRKEFRSKILGAEKTGKYWASGISVVAHMKNPKIPAIHFNTRFIVTSKEWFGGGMDVTPAFKDKSEEKKLHQKLKLICKQNKKNYLKYKNWCDNYFYLPHRNEARGIGGIFFDYEKKNWKENFKFIRDLGLAFIDITKDIIIKKNNVRWSRKDKNTQLLKRGKYVEFNLLYDRGTKFGFNSGGNIESILMSLPRNAKWK